jgi:hypothetical protein
MSDFFKINRNGQIFKAIPLKGIEKKVERTQAHEIQRQ